MDHRSSFFDAVRLKVEYLIPNDDKRMIAGNEPIILTPSSLTEIATAAARSQSSLFGDRPVCVISEGYRSDQTFKRTEHLIPEGLGYGWAALPAGMGTCDQVNHEFGRYEMEWLRHGVMGMYRPFYVSKGKDDPPAFYAPSKDNSKFVMTSVEGGRLEIRVYGDEPIPPPVDNTIEFTVETTNARSVFVSLALHKLSFLSLWLAWGVQVFHPGFKPLLDFLNRPAKDNYRPFLERMIEGAPPGVDLSFLIHMQPADATSKQFDVREVWSTLRIHHLQYGLKLMGAFDSERDAQVGWTPWTDPAIRPTLETRRIPFGFDRMFKPGEDEDDR